MVLNLSGGILLKFATGLTLPGPSDPPQFMPPFRPRLSLRVRCACGCAPIRRTFHSNLCCFDGAAGFASSSAFTLLRPADVPNRGLASSPFPHPTTTACPPSPTTAYPRATPSTFGSLAFKQCRRVRLHRLSSRLARHTTPLRRSSSRWPPSGRHACQ